MMKKVFILSLLLAFAFPTFAQQDRNREQIRQERCENAQTRVQERRNHYEERKEYYNNRYEAIRARVSRAVEFLGDDYNTADLEAAGEELKGFAEEARAQHEAVRESIDAIHEYVCGSDFDGTRDRDELQSIIDASRVELDDLRQIHHDARSYIIETIRPLLMDLRDQVLDKVGSDDDSNNDDNDLNDDNSDDLTDDSSDDGDDDSSDDSSDDGEDDGRDDSSDDSSDDE